MKLSEQSYKLLSAGERAALVMNAVARQDEQESTRLVQTCPCSRIMELDANYRDKIMAIIMLSRFIERQGWKYFVFWLNGFENDEPTQLGMDAMNGLLRLASTWKTFCDEVGLDPEAPLKAYLVDGVPLWYEVAKGVRDTLTDKKKLPDQPEVLEILRKVWIGTPY